MFSFSTAVPPLAPIAYLEPYSHFYTESSDVSGLFSTLRSTLQNSQDAIIDCNCHADQFTIHCTTYADHLSLQFIARIYSTDSPNKFIVELQKRKGDGFMFHHIYKLVENELCHRNSNNSLSTECSLDLAALAASLPMPSLTAHRAPELPAALPLPDSDDVNSSNHPVPTRDDIIETIRCLLDMACSDCSDIGINGIAGLASLSSSKCALTRELLSSSEYVSNIISLLSSGCENIHRCALTVLANLCQNSPQVSSYVLENQDAVTQLAQLSQSSVSQVVRETARTINAICSSIPNSLAVQQDSLKNIVVRLAQSDDVVTRQQATQASNFFTAK